LFIEIYLKIEYNLKSKIKPPLTSILSLEGRGRPKVR
jgi:hypothetical protein